jgi:integrase
MPRSHLTDAALKRIKPPSKREKVQQVDHFDARYPGLAFRVSYGDTRSWVFVYRYQGKQRRKTLGKYPALGLAEARDKWREARAKLDKGEDPAAEAVAAQGPNGFKDVMERWLALDQAGNRTKGEAERILRKHFLPVFEQQRIGDVTTHQIIDIIDGIADRGTVTAARRCHTRLQRLFSWAVERRIIGVSPMLGLSKPGAEVERERVLTDDELRRVWAAAQLIGWPIGSAVQLLILTCARRDEIGALRWQEISEGHIHLVGARTKKAHYDIPLSTAARALIDTLPRVKGSPLVFTTTGTTPISGWSRAKRNLDLAMGIIADPDTLGFDPDKLWRIHDLRRTAATWMQASGVQLQVVEAVLGHTAGSRAGVVGIYQRHTYAAEKREAIEMWGAHVAALVRDVVPTAAGRALLEVAA